jgi:hypothetical protein
MRRANPSGGIPMFLIDGQVKVGFSSRGLKAAIQRAARRRAASGG